MNEQRRVAYCTYTAPLSIAGKIHSRYDISDSEHIYIPHIDFEWLSVWLLSYIKLN
jgi:hypothetical protein